MECIPNNEEGLEWCLGIDEAGRGPVLGPMVYACCFTPVKTKKEFGALGFQDSKQLTEVQRENLFEKMKKTQKMPIGWLVEVLEPEELSYKMLRINKVNLNAISHDAAIKLIRRALDLKFKITEVFVDTVGIASKYESKLKQLFPEIPNITVSKKADSLYPVVSAASIVAKVTRDHRLRNWEFKETDLTISNKFGSGYPSDPATQTWLKQHLDPIFGFPTLLRFSWKTSTQLIDEGGVNVVWFESDMEESKLRLQERMNRYKYFAENCMEIVKDFD